MLENVSGAIGKPLFEDESDRQNEVRFTEKVICEEFTVRHQNPDSLVRFYDENDKLLHVRIRTDGQQEDAILYKTGHDLVITSTTPTYQAPTRNVQNINGNIFFLILKRYIRLFTAWGWLSSGGGY